MFSAIFSVGNKTFLDSAMPLIRGHLQELWLACEKPSALYARGSSIVPVKELVFQPWDIDFVLFVASNKTRAEHMTAVAMEKILSAKLNVPPPDIKVVLTDYNYETLYTLLLVSADASLILGKDIRLPLAYFKKHYHALWIHSLTSCRSRLTSFEQCSDPVELKKRAPHLSKSVLRLGGLLRLQQGSFTRDPKECANSLIKMYPIVERSTHLLLKSFETAIKPLTLAEACRSILLVAEEVFIND